MKSGKWPETKELQQGLLRVMGTGGLHATCCLWLGKSPTFPKLRSMAQGSRPLEVGSGCFCLGDNHCLPVAGAESWHRLCPAGTQGEWPLEGKCLKKSMLAPELSQPTGAQQSQPTGAQHCHSDPGRKIFID